MVIQIGQELETVLNEYARRQGISAENLALATLQDRFLPTVEDESRDDWERKLRRLRVDCGVSLSDTAVGSEGIYE
jgi:hypothetical protein